MSVFELKTNIKRNIDGHIFDIRVDEKPKFDILVTKFRVNVVEKKNRSYNTIHLDPEDESFYNELRDLMPGYNFELTVDIYTFCGKKHIAPVIEVIDNNGDHVVFMEKVDLSVKEYDYLRDIVLKYYPDADILKSNEYKEETAREYIAEQNYGVINNSKLPDYIAELTAKRVDEVSDVNSMEFDAKALEIIAIDVANSLIHNLT